MDDVKGLQSVIELLKIETFLEMIDLFSDEKDDDHFRDFIITLVKNGCPASAIIVTIKEMADKSRDQEEE